MPLIYYDYPVNRFLKYMYVIENDLVFVFIQNMMICIFEMFSRSNSKTYRDWHRFLPLY